MPLSPLSLFPATLRFYPWFVQLLLYAPLLFLTLPGLLLLCFWSGVCSSFHTFYPWMVRLRPSRITLDWLILLNLYYATDGWVHCIPSNAVAGTVHRRAQMSLRRITILRHQTQTTLRLVRRIFQSGYQCSWTLLHRSAQHGRKLTIRMVVRTNAHPLMLYAMIMASQCLGTTLALPYTSNKATIDFTTMFKTRATSSAKPNPIITERVRQFLHTFEGCTVIGNRFPTALLGETNSDPENKTTSTTCRNNLRYAAARQGLQALNTGPADLFRIICDSGASLTCIGNKEEFVQLVERSTPTELKGIASGLAIKGEGTVRYNVRDDTGQTIELEANAYWVPQLESMRLLAPQSLRTAQGNMVTIICHGTLPNGEPSFAELQVRNKGVDWHSTSPLQRLTIPYDPKSNLPELKGSIPANEEKQVMALSGILQVTDDANRNLTGAQKELLKWHYRLGHVGFQWLQWLIRSGRITVSNKNSLSKCPPPKCAACEYGKAMRRATEATTVMPKPDKEMELKQGDLIPGQRISVDHYQSAVPGRLYSSRGSTTASNKFHGGAIFVDHASGHVSLVHQVSLSGTDTVKAKLHFERAADESGVVIQSYHTDNGVFKSDQFVTELLKNQQTIRFSGSGAAHQNGVAERAILNVVNMARTMMLHAAMRSADGSLNTDLWSMAMDYAVWIYNHLPRRDSGASPEELWTRTTSDTPLLLADCHVWGCPVFVLEPKLQKSGIKIPKWHPRSRRGILMGFSPQHSTLITLILNLASGSITPQFHVVFDDMFHTVASPDDDLPEIWGRLIDCGPCHMQVMLDEDGDFELHDDWLGADERTERDNWRRQQAVSSNRDTQLHPLLRPLRGRINHHNWTYSRPLALIATSQTQSIRLLLLFQALTVQLILLFLHRPLASWSHLLLACLLPLQREPHLPVQPRFSIPS